MSKLSASQIYTLLIQGGFTPHQATVMTAIAQAESARHLDAVGDRNLVDHTWGPSVGLFQIRTLKSQTGTGGDRDIDHLRNNPEAQVKAALQISDHGKSFHPWSTYLHGTYKQYLDDNLHDGAALPHLSTAEQVASGEHDQLAATHLPTGNDLFAIDKGLAPVAVVDTDGDGLTDQFEKLLGTNPELADSDHDGLSDTYETTVSHTDPMNADTNKDGITDGVELARSLDAGHVDVSAAARAAGFGGLNTLDSDHDGLSDAYEHRIGTNPFAADTDHDTIPDGLEVAHDTNPLSLDSDNDGLSDGYAATHGLSSDHLADPAAGADPADHDFTH